MEKIGEVGERERKRCIYQAVIEEKTKEEGWSEGSDIVVCLYFFHSRSFKKLATFLGIDWKDLHYWITFKELRFGILKNVGVLRRADKVIKH